MMVLEMVGMRHNSKAEVNRSSEIYFPHLIYSHLESNQELGLQNIRNESDDKLVRKMTIVGLWCIQTYPSTRPAISRVVEMLESKVELLQIPPKPRLSSPPTSPAHFSRRGRRIPPFVIHSLMPIPLGCYNLMDFNGVKILNELKENGEEFINEVASISKTSHINIVTLLGFCYHGSKGGALVLSNESLEKFIFEENALTTDRQLDFQTLYHIAIGVARGLEYLHKGCNTRILHFDKASQAITFSWMRISTPRLQTLV
ncbi:hypothetical protein GLYMA_10G271801v4 [Glycine max]|nr:hypothetical protein GLYMA_10G271801v4 [Glycine max]